MHVPVVSRRNSNHEGRIPMGSSGKKKTTMAKLSRESRLRERRMDKKARKDARKLAAANGDVEPDTTLDGELENENEDENGDAVLAEAPAGAEV
jgi:hypothetical protein